jgi:ficolin
MMHVFISFIFLGNVYAQLLSETSISRISHRLNELENDVYVIRNSKLEDIRDRMDDIRDEFKNMFDDLKNDVRELRKDLKKETDFRREDISILNKKVTGHSGQVLPNNGDPEDTKMQLSPCQCAAAANFESAMKTFKTEKTLNLKLRHELNDIKQKQTNTFAKLQNMESNVIERDTYLLKNIDNIKRATAALQNRFLDNSLICQYNIDSIRRTVEEGLTHLNESLASYNSDVQQELSWIRDDLVAIQKSAGEVNALNKNTHRNPCNKVSKSGIYVYTSNLDHRIEVYCDIDPENKGWIVIQRRNDGSEDFNRTWADYKSGFGNMNGEFWLGNENLYQLTKDRPRELRIDMETFDGRKVRALYSEFSVSAERDKYRLSVAGYSGDAGDSLINVAAGRVHNGQMFSTYDADNDNRSYDCCACSWSGGGWWYNTCFRANLNGKYFHKNANVPMWHGINWFTVTGDSTSLKFVEMKIH